MQAYKRRPTECRNTKMSKHGNMLRIVPKALLLALLFSLFASAACGTGAGSSTGAIPTTEDTVVTAVAVLPTSAPSPTSTAVPTSVNQLAASFTAAGAGVVNNGHSEQGLFSGEGTGLWHLTVDEAIVNVYEFSSIAAREAVSRNISPRGNEYTVTEGDTSVTTTWDSEGVSRWWALDNLLVH